MPRLIPVEDCLDETTDKPAEIGYRRHYLGASISRLSRRLSPRPYGILQYGSIDPTDRFFVPKEAWARLSSKVTAAGIVT